MRRATTLVTSATFACVVLGRASAQDAPPAKPPEPPVPEAAEDPFRPPAILAQRRKPTKEAGVDAAVASGLDWLRRHVADDGRWDCDGFSAHCTLGRCGGDGLATFDPGVTALAVLAFLGAGRTQSEGADAAIVGPALKFLCDVQDSEGCFGPRTSSRFIYNTAAAATAMAEAYWLTGDPALRDPAQRGCGFLMKAQNPYLAWRYGFPPDGDNDTSVTIWCSVALRTGAFASLEVTKEAYVSARTWIEKMTAQPGDGRVGYQQRGGYDARAWAPERTKDPDPEPAPKPRRPGEREILPLAPSIGRDIRSEGTSSEFSAVPSEVLDRFPSSRWSSLTAGAALVTTLTGGAESAANVDRWVALVARDTPSVARGGFLDLHYLVYGSLLGAQRPFAEKPPKDAAEKKSWRTWRDVAVAELTRTQSAKTTGCAAGSWDPAQDPFGFAGGRVYATAMALLALEAPNRFPRVWDPKVKLLPPSKK